MYRFKLIKVFEDKLNLNDIIMDTSNPTSNYLIHHIPLGIS